MTRHHRIIITVATALAFGAGAVPASARPVDVTANGSSVPAGPVGATLPYSHVKYIPRASGSPSGAPDESGARLPHDPRPRPLPSSIAPTTAAVPSKSVRVVAHSGFDWGDAGIGAAGGLAISLLGIGGVMTVTQRRTRRAATALTT